jgi:hypothetical protein
MTTLPLERLPIPGLNSANRPDITQRTCERAYTQRTCKLTPEYVAETLTAHLCDPSFSEKDVAIDPKKDLPEVPGLPKAPDAALTFGFGAGLDPLTAGFNAAAAFFNFLSTTEGQRICKDIIDLDEFFVKKCKEVFDKIHDRVQKG